MDRAGHTRRALVIVLASLDAIEDLLSFFLSDNLSKIIQWLLSQIVFLQTMIVHP